MESDKLDFDDQATDIVMTKSFIVKDEDLKEYRHNKHIAPPI